MADTKPYARRLTPAKPQVIVAPYFRTMDEIFRPETLARLESFADVVWGRDGAMDQAAFERALTDAAAVVFGTWSYGDAMHRAGPELRALLEVAGAHSHHGVGYPECLAKGIEVGSVAPAFGPAVAELALGLTLAATRGIVDNDRDFRRGAEEWLHAGNAGYDALFGRTVGFIGCGGLSVALHTLLAPFEVEVVGHDPFIPATALQARGIRPADLPEVIAGADVVFVLATPTPANRGLLSRELLEELRPTQSLILVSRAHLVDFDALTELALAGRFRAAIDVFPEEPLPRDHPLREAENVVLSSHRAGAVPQALLTIGDMVTEDLEAIIEGRPQRRLQYLTSDRLEGLLNPQ